MEKRKVVRRKESSGRNQQCPRRDAADSVVPVARLADVGKSEESGREPRARRNGSAQWAAVVVQRAEEARQKMDDWAVVETFEKERSQQLRQACVCSSRPCHSPARVQGIAHPAWHFRRLIRLAQRLQDCQYGRMREFHSHASLGSVLLSPADECDDSLGTARAKVVQQESSVCQRRKARASSAGL